MGVTRKPLTYTVGGFLCLEASLRHAVAAPSST